MRVREFLEKTATARNEQEVYVAVEVDGEWKIVPIMNIRIEGDSMFLEGVPLITGS